MHAHFADINHRTHWEGFEELESAPVLVVVVQEELELIAVMVLVQSWVLPEPQWYWATRLRSLSKR